MLAIQYWRWVVFASFGGVVIFLMIITLIGALIWKEKFQNFNLQNDDYLKEIVEELKDFKLKTKKIEYQLPKDEIAYLDQTAVMYFQTSSKFDKNILFFENKFKFTERRIFNPKKINSLNIKVILTNKHILIETENDFLKYKIEKTYIKPITFSNTQEIFKGHEVVVEDKRFLLYTQNNDLWLTFKKIRGE